VAATLKKLRRYANALSYVRGIVLDKKLAAQLATYAGAVETFSDALRSLQGEVFDGPCAMNSAIQKRAKRDRKLRDAIALIGYGQ
jgi:hypothetical protein